MAQIKSQNEIKLHQSWKNQIGSEFQKPYFEAIKAHLVQEFKTGQLIYPPAKNIFAAFDLCPFDALKVVILGQDPYHGAGQAHGLSFSVPEGIGIPPSLRNIFKEIQSDLGKPIPENGNLERWANQGVLLLNAILSVRANQAASHRKIGWETFTDAVIQKISEQKQGVVFLLWGNFAKNKAHLIDASKHLILTAPHPSPLARGFSGCKHFSQANNYLKQNGLAEINW